MRGLMLIAGLLVSGMSHAQSFEIRNAAGVEMTVDTEDRNPALLVTVPDGPEDDRKL